MKGNNMNNSLAIYENFAQTRDIANALASSDLVPPHFQKKPSNVLIALEFAHRNDIAPFAAMQSMFVIHGRVGMNASMAISLARKHNVWKSLTYKTTGSGASLSVTAIAKLHDDSEASATVTMQMANDAGWSKNAIYKSIPEQMLKYRAATFLIRAHFPEVLFGMSTVEELNDVHAAKNVTPAKVAPLTIDVEPALETAPAPVEPEPQPEPQNVAPDGSFNDLKVEILDFINTRPEVWFKTVGKLKGNIISVIESTMTYDEMIKMQTIVETLEKKYQAMTQEQYANPKQ
jgi:hypothetical protein